MIGIKELIVLQKSYIEHVFENIEWKHSGYGSLLNDDECNQFDEEEHLQYFFGQAFNDSYKCFFDFIDFIEKYKINNIDDVITGETVSDLIK